MIGVRIRGTSAGSKVYIEDTIIEGNLNTSANNGRGISDERTAGGNLFISNTTVRNNAQIGVLVGPVAANLDNVRVQNSVVGISALSGARLVVARSVVAGNTSAGIRAEGHRPPLRFICDRTRFPATTLAFRCLLA